MKKAAEFILKSWRPLVLVYAIVAAVAFIGITVFLLATWRETEKEKELWPDFEFDYPEETGIQKAGMMILSFFVALGCAILWPAIPLLIAGGFFISKTAQHFPDFSGICWTARGIRAEIERGCFSVNTVEPIRDMDLIFDMMDFLKGQNFRDYVIFMFGIYTGLRISDILKLRVRDVKDKDAVYIREKKTGKEKRFAINDELKPVIVDFIKGKRDFEYLFKSPNFPNKPISRQQAYNILNAAADAVGIKDNIGTHTLRKTFGYHMHKQGVSLATLKEIFNHSSEAVTARYIGINQDIQDMSIKGLSYHKGGARGKR